MASAVLGASAAGVLANLASHPIDTAKTVIQADVTGEKYRGLVQSIAELYRSQGLRGLYLGGLARTIRTCGAFFIVSVIREKCIQYKSKREAEKRAKQAEQAGLLPKARSVRV